MSFAASEPPIAIFLEDLGGGGAEKISVTLANGLAAQGHRVDLLMWRAEGPYLAAVAPNVRQINFSAERPAGFIKVLRALRHYYQCDQPRILLAQLEKPSLVAIFAALLCGYHAVVPCVHIDLLSYTRHAHRLRRMLLLGLVFLLYRLVPRIIAVSQGTADGVQRLMGAGCPPLAVIYNGFNLQALADEARQSVAVAWFQNKSVPVIITSGRLVSQKAHDVLVQAFARVVAQQPARLIILGEGAERSALAAQIKQLGLMESVAMPGFVTNPAAWVAKSDVFVLASRNEGLSNVLIEAMAVGTPVVSTDCPSGPREVLGDGRFGRLVKVDDAEALSGAIIATLQSPRGEPSTALAAHLEQFTAPHMVMNYLKIIDDVTPPPR